MHAFPYAYQEADSFKMVDHFSSVQLNNNQGHGKKQHKTQDVTLIKHKIFALLEDYLESIESTFHNHLIRDNKWS